jgi:hypothetical protein
LKPDPSLEDGLVKKFFGDGTLDAAVKVMRLAMAAWRRILLMSRFE